MSYNFDFGGFDVRDLPGHYESFSQIAEKMQAAISDPSVCVKMGDIKRFESESKVWPESYYIDITLDGNTDAGRLRIGFDMCVDHRGNLRIGVDRFYRVSPSDPQVLSFTIDLTGEAMSR